MTKRLLILIPSMILASILILLLSMFVHGKKLGSQLQSQLDRSAAAQSDIAVSRSQSIIELRRIGLPRQCARALTLPGTALAFLDHDQASDRAISLKVEYLPSISAPDIEDRIAQELTGMAESWNDYIKTMQDLEIAATHIDPMFAREWLRTEGRGNDLRDMDDIAVVWHLSSLKAAGVELKAGGPNGSLTRPASAYRASASKLTRGTGGEECSDLTDPEDL